MDVQRQYRGPLDKVAPMLKALGIGMVLIANRKTLCRRGWHPGHLISKESGILFHCPLCETTIEVRFP